MTKGADELNQLAEFLNKEHETLFGVNPGLTYGVMMVEVEIVKQRIFNYYIERMKEMLERAGK